MAGGGKAMDWAKVAALWDAVINEDFKPKVLVLHPRQISNILITYSEFQRRMLRRLGGYRWAIGMQVLY